MKTIFVATDFSKASHDASLYGMRLAEAFNARLILFNSYDHVRVPAGKRLSNASEGLESLIQNRLKAKAKIINPENAVDLKPFCNEGPAEESILKAAKHVKADIIVVGMKKTGRGFRKLFGSTVTALAAATSIPLIVVPEGVRYSSPVTIALANESDLEKDADKHLLDSLIEIGEKFYSRIYLVRVAKNKHHESFEVLNRPVRLNKMVSSLHPQYECHHGVSTPQALNDFISKNSVDMLALLPHKHSLLERLFIKSITRSMVFEAHIPLFIIPPESNKRESKEILTRATFLDTNVS
jgi:nucleotide-binding universal stress UspA family protein